MKHIWRSTYRGRAATCQTDGLDKNSDEPTPSPGLGPRLCASAEEAFELRMGLTSSWPILSSQCLMTPTWSGGRLTKRRCSTPKVTSGKSGVYLNIFFAKVGHFRPLPLKKKRSRNTLPNTEPLSQFEPMVNPDFGPKPSRSEVSSLSIRTNGTTGWAGTADYIVSEPCYVTVVYSNTALVERKSSARFHQRMQYQWIVRHPGYKISELIDPSPVEFWTVPP